MIVDGTTPGDVKQGALGDCWFLGSITSLATHSELLQNLMLYDGIEYGFCVFQFFKNGEWKYVIIDTLIPTNSKTGKPIYGRCDENNEFWLPLMEKAFAKLHGSYEVNYSFGILIV
jgi:hypothetical protein